MGDAVITRVQTNGPPTRPRNLEEQLMVRFPALYRGWAKLLFQLPPRSRARRAVLRRATVSGWGAFNREDFELMMIRYASDVEFQFTPDEQMLGLSGTFIGHEAVLEGIKQLLDAWTRVEEPVYILDLKGRVVVLGYARTRGETSGIELEQEFGEMITARHGLIVRDQAWFSWDDTLRAAGLDPATLSLPRRSMGSARASSA